MRRPSTCPGRLGNVDRPNTSQLWTPMSMLRFKLPRTRCEAPPGLRPAKAPRGARYSGPPEDLAELVLEHAARDFVSELVSGEESTAAAGTGREETGRSLVLAAKAQCSDSAGAHFPATDAPSQRARSSWS